MLKGSLERLEVANALFWQALGSPLKCRALVGQWPVAKRAEGSTHAARVCTEKARLPIVTHEHVGEGGSARACTACP